MNILVTGGAGYIGSHTVERLIDCGHNTTVYDSLCTGHKESIPRGILAKGCLSDKGRITKILRNNHIEAVIHFAALTSVGESVADPGRYYSNNLTFTLNLLDAMRETGVRMIVSSSSAAVYGTVGSSKITETTRKTPQSPYGFTKLAIEQALTDYSLAYGFAAASLRYFNAVGASESGRIGEDHSPESHLIPLALKVALGQLDHIDILGDDYETHDGTCIRDYVHVSDLAEAHINAINVLEPSKHIQLNLGTGTGHSVLEVISACKDVTGNDIPTRVAPRRPGDPPQLVADCALARRVLAWNPRYTSIKETIETAWRWHRDHPHGYRTSK
jgi:UDP-glucose 4-epimerase